MRLPDVAMIAAETVRTRVYVQALVQHALVPAAVLILHNTSPQSLPGQQAAPEERRALDLGGFLFNPAEPLEDTLATVRVPVVRLDSADINSNDVVAAITARPEPVLIYSGYGGAILRDAILNTGKKFLHVHGGYLPDYKGSTTNYYSLLQENACGASALFLAKEIDSGPVLLRRKFPRPPGKADVDYIYDSALRARVLVEVLQRYAARQGWDYELRDNSGGETYFIIHPVLKHIALLAGAPEGV